MLSRLLQRQVSKLLVLMRDLGRLEVKFKRLWSPMKLPSKEKLTLSSLAETCLATPWSLIKSMLAKVCISLNMQTLLKWKKESSTLSRLLDLLEKATSVEQENAVTSRES